MLKTELHWGSKSKEHPPFREPQVGVPQYGGEGRPREAAVGHSRLEGAQPGQMEKHLGVRRAEFINLDLHWSLMALSLRQAGRAISGSSSLTVTTVDDTVNSKLWSALDIRSCIPPPG